MEKEFQKNLVFSLVILAILRLVAGLGLADNRAYNECFLRWEKDTDFIGKNYKADNAMIALADNRAYIECTEGQNFTRGGQTDKNLLVVLSSLANRAARSGGFNTSIYGKVPNSIYAMGQCRGDMTSSTCLSCLQSAISSVPQLCGTSPGGKFWHDECFLRWEKDTDFIGKNYKAEEPPYYYNAIIASAEFRNVVTGLMTNLTRQAVTKITRAYSSGTAQDSKFGKVFGLVQCWRDISIDDCQSCLFASLQMISRYAVQLGGTSFRANCYARYEVYSFFTPDPSPPPPQTASQPQPPQSLSRSTPSKDGSKNRLPLILGSVAGFILVLIIALVFGYCYALKRKARPSKARRSKNDKESGEEYLENDDGLIIFTKEALMAATADFGEEHKIGQGGFGVVYKGILQDGKEVAIKKLSIGSLQGRIEFINEIRLLSKIQQRNLVSLLGCCIEDSERILVYEFVTNGSLNKFLFDVEKKKQLDWRRRIHIINGIARGLLYLHEESKFKIIHRDIKGSNILLDDKFNAKIADFGLAKLFGEGQSGMETRVVGTYGYMAPEYVMHGRLSSKADIYSFGVVLLQILSGKRKNDSFNKQSFLEWVWKLHKEGNYVEMIDENIKATCNYEVAIRCIHVALLCTQANPTMRPPMSEITIMLSSSLITLHSPTMPAFISGIDESRNSSDSNHGNPSQDAMSANVSITSMEPR